MKFIIWLLALFAAAVALTLASHNPGYVQIVYPPYRIEVSLTLFGLSLLGLFVLLYALIRMSLAVVLLPAYVRNFREERSHNKGRAAIAEALTAYFEGRYSAAEKAAVRAMELGEKSDLIPIVAARAAHEQRQFERRDAYLVDAKSKYVGENTMRLMAQTEFMLDQKQAQSALESLKEFGQKGERKHIGALTLELKAQQQAGNWDSVLDVVSQLEKRNAIDEVLATQMRQQVWLEKLRSPSLDIASLRGLWKSVPTEFKRRPKLVVTVTQEFLKRQDALSAGKLLLESLNAQWDSELVSLYGDCHTDDIVAQINQAERWLKVHADDAGLLLALGKLCLHQGLWGKAQSYLDASLSLQSSRAAYSALAQLAEKLNKREEAFNYYRLAMGPECAP